MNELMAKVGREAFLDIEAKVNSEICASRCVIATGGSVIYRENAVKALAKTGVIVYLQLPYEVIASRLGDLVKRGVALKEGDTLYDLYNERTPLYEKYADICVPLNNGNIQECVTAVANALKEAGI